MNHQSWIEEQYSIQSERLDDYPIKNLAKGPQDSTYKPAKEEIQDPKDSRYPEREEFDPLIGSTPSFIEKGKSQ